MLPTQEDINGWNNEHLKSVYNLLFVKNVNPQLSETREEVDEYLHAVNSEMEYRKLK